MGKENNKQKACELSPGVQEVAVKPWWLPEKWDKETDVLVVGAANAGLPAAIEAATAGAEVIVLEKNDWVGGLMKMSPAANAFYWNTHVQRRLGIEDRVEWGIADEMLMSDYRAVPELVRTYVEKGAETCLWLEQHGIVWEDRLMDGDWGTGVLRNHIPAKSSAGYYEGGAPGGGGGIALATVLLKAIEKQGTPILLKHRMKSIYREPNGPVLGVKADTPKGSINIKARKAVIVATGGWTANEQMVKAWDPRLVDDCIYPDGLPYMACMGDGILAGLDVGAGLSDMSFVSFLPISWGSHWYSLYLSGIRGKSGVPIGKKGYQRIILVKNDGDRYINEQEGAKWVGNRFRPAEYPEQAFMATFLSLPQPRNVWAVTDAEGAKAMNWPKGQMRNPQPMAGKGLHADSVAVAKSLRLLAGKMGVDTDNFDTTVSRYNGFVDAGVDQDFGKPQPLYPIATPPFFGARFNVLRHTQCGGLRVNTKAQVLDRSEQYDARFAKSIDEEKVIPHLYAAGECSACIGWRRAHRKLGIYMTFGRIAGKNAAAERPWS